MSSTRSSFTRRCGSVISRFQQEPPSRTPSLIATVFGDVVESHGGEIWLGSLTRLTAPIGINERLVRTSVFRLAQDGTIEGHKQGRRRFYAFTQEVRPQVRRFEQRIYHLNDGQWDGQWRLVFTGTQGIDADTRAEIRKRILWLGYGSIAPNVFGHPTAEMTPLWDLLEEFGVADRVVVMRASNFDRTRGLGTREMVRQCFKLDSLALEYQEFVRRFAPLDEAISDGKGADCDSPEHAFVLRTMLIHQFRRILLHDPDIPQPLLPENWIGNEARRICASLYNAIEEASEEYILSICEDHSGPFRPATEEFTGRFRSSGP